MLSKLRPVWQSGVRGLLARDLPAPPARRAALVPPNQYDTPLGKRFNLMYVLKVYWETIPLFVTSFLSISLVIGIFVWDAQNKVDLVFTPNSRNNISRTMDLRNPTVHKIITINQRYAPWPEMQDVLDKMKAAEKRLLSRAETCGFVAS